MKVQSGLYIYKKVQIQEEILVRHLLSGHESNRTTRQREVVNTLFENWTSVEKAKKITEQSEGSSDEKMEYYKDSVEASRNRLTAALEKLVSGQGIEKVLIFINNTH